MRAVGNFLLGMLMASPTLANALPEQDLDVRFRSAFRPFVTEARANAVIHWCRSLVAATEKRAVDVQATWAFRNGPLYRAALRTQIELFEESKMNGKEWAFRQFRDIQLPELRKQAMASQARIIFNALNTAHREEICTRLLDEIEAGQLDLGADDKGVREYLGKRAMAERDQPN
ncbi:hypothetical protein [Acidovorax sp. Q11]